MAQRSRISVADKLRLIRAHRADQDFIAVADILGIKRSSARNIVSKAMRKDDPEQVTEGSRGGARYAKVDDEMRAFLELALGRNPAITLKILNLQMRERFPNKPTITDSHLSKVCHGMFYSIKKLETAPFDR